LPLPRPSLVFGGKLSLLHEMRNALDKVKDPLAVAKRIGYSAQIG
jgi:hypothetical protein